MKLKLSNTNQRRIILEELKVLKNHPTADELYMLVRQKLPKISLGTVYRNLELLSAAGHILKLEMSGKQKRFDGRPDQHFHMRCSLCEKVFDLEDKSFQEIDNLMQAKLDELQCDGYSLEIHGLCEGCRESGMKKERA
jgi:Fur family transcriptional regulator, peroxide stress response regulator